MDIFGGSLVLMLLLIYLLLWRLKRAALIRAGEGDPEVFQRSPSNLQRYMGGTIKFMTGYALALIILHASNLQYASLFSRFAPLNHPTVKFIGFGIGLIGLALCRAAQLRMGRSWRVGIDTDHPTDLVTTGLYRTIRNPTYAGLFLLNLGIWLIWPTWTVFLFNVLFIYCLDLQVRCEEDFLESVHGEAYRAYKRRTKRYIPGIY